MSDSIRSSIKILIIDDDEDISNLFSQFLKKEGFKVKSFIDPFKALEEIEQKPKSYSLIITDIRMPGMSGIELVRRICSLNQNIKVIIMSAFELDGNDLTKVGYEKFIGKPVHMRSLVEAIDEIVKS